jgi:hypothetical protein
MERINGQMLWRIGIESIPILSYFLRIDYNEKYNLTVIETVPKKLLPCLPGFLCYISVADDIYIFFLSESYIQTFKTEYRYNARVLSRRYNA